MKANSLILIVFVALWHMSCQPHAAFEKPQPIDVKPLGEFPSKVKGKYLSLLDSTIINISSRIITRTYDFTNVVHVSQLDTTLQLIGDSLFDHKTGKNSPVTIEGDSVIWQMNETDTLFMIDELNVLKKLKGYYFVNIYLVPDRWEVKKLEFSKKFLIISNLNKEEDITQLKELTANHQDTVPYLFSPTQKQFKKFIKNNGFRNTEKFVKINN